MKKIHLYITLISIFHLNAMLAQNVGGHGNGQASPREVKASELTKGAYTADVNLFTGALSSSYTLGSVSTPSGLSFTLSMDYSSGYSGGNDVPLVNGVPYGEGWSLNLPTISVTTVELSKYSRSLMAHNDEIMDDALYNEFTSTEAEKEATPYWFSPQISIPGVINERFVYKYTDKNGDGDIVFVPAKFDTYVEARLKDNAWRVILADGTVYEFGLAVVGYRNASNQRYVQDNSSTPDGFGGYVPGKPQAGAYTPKEEMMGWKVTKIYHPNYPNHQHIDFVYDRFGAFDYHREFQQPLFILASGTGVGYNFTAYKDVILKEVVSGEDFGAQYIEKIVLNYRTQNFSGTPAASGDMLLPWTEGVGNNDSLYNYKTVYTQGLESTEISKFDMNATAASTPFTNWLRYHHVRSDEAQTAGYATNQMLGSNPYVYSTDATGAAPDGGVYVNPGHTDEYLLPDRAAASPAVNLPFNHCFLESQIISGLIPGDIYELRTLISKSGSASDFCNFDVNVVAGDNSSPESVPTGITNIPYNTYKGHRSTTVFSTFSQPVKWNMSGSGAKNVLTSNFFSLSNLPKDFDGIRIQVGPANSDHDFALYGSTGSAIAEGHNISNPPNSYYAYTNYENAGVSTLLQRDGCSPIPENFGIGLEWHMMRRIYSDMSDYSYNTNCSRYHFWWKLISGTGSSVSWDNIPTAADDHVELNAVELVRYSKNPYMLNYVKTYRCNGADDTHGTNRSVMTSMVKMNYEVVRDTIKDNYDPAEGIPSGGSYGGGGHLKYIYLMKSISEIPVNASNGNAALTSYDTTKAPTTYYEYTKMNMNSYAPGIANFNYNTLDNSSDRTNGNTYPLTQITDRLGGVTQYQYYRPSEHIHISNSYQWSPLGGYIVSRGTISGEIDMEQPVALSFSLCVKKKTVADATTSSIPKEWLYSYSTSKSFELTPSSFASSIGADFYVEANQSENGFMTTTVEEPFVDSNPNRVRTEYKHYTDEYNWLLFGKLKQSIAYDAGNHMLEKKEFKYKVRQAYYNGLYRSANYTTSQEDGSDPLIYRQDQNGDYEGTGSTPVDYAVPPAIYGNVLSNYEYTDRMELLEWTNSTLFTTRYLSSYFTPLIKEITTSYDQLLTGSMSVALTPGGIAPVPIGSVKMMTGDVASGIAGMPAFYPIHVDMDSVKNITEYEYWDADSIGHTQSNGYKVLNGSITGGVEILQYEPSWELYKKTTYSPQLPGAYSSEENFYFFDLRNYTNNPSHADTLMNLYGLNWSEAYHMRSLPYETRTTGKSQGKWQVRKSNYYWYDQRFEMPFESGDADYSVNYTSAPGDCDLLRSYTITPPPTTCITADTTVGSYPPPGYKVTVDSTGAVLWCPETFGDYTADTHQPRTLLFTRSLKNKLFLRYTSGQVDTLLTDDVRYTDPGDGHILRFKTNTTTLLTEPVFPYRSHVDYYVEERNMYGQVALEHDTKGLETLYEYAPRVNIDYEDLNSTPCPGHVISSMPYLGLPVAITVGYTLPDALITSYTYKPDNSVASVSDLNGLAEYSYDEFGRLEQTKRNSEIISINNYHNWENNFTETFEQRAADNYVESYTLNNSGSNVAERSRAYVDPQGRKYDVLTQVSPDYTTPAVYDTKMVHSGLTTYDNWNRAVAQYKTFKTTDVSGVDFTPAFNPADPKTEQRYENTQRSKVLRASKYGENITSGYTVNSSYKLVKGTAMASDLGLSSTEKTLLMPGGTGLYTFMKTAVIDEDGKKVVTWTDAIGRQVATKTYISYSNAAVTLFYYNSTGQQELVINPAKQASVYNYNLSGQLYDKATPDGGETRYIYNERGQLVLEEDANARAGTGWTGPYMRRYNYDDFGRMIKQERVTYSGSSSLHPFYWTTFDDGTNRLTFSYATTTDYAFNLQYNTGTGAGPWVDVSPYAGVSSAAVEKEFTYHNAVETTDAVYAGCEASIHTYLGTYAQTNLAGRVSTSTSYDNAGTANEYKIYSYNAEGLPSYEITQFVKGVISIPSIITYPKYNLRNTLQQEKVDIGLDGTTEMEYRYAYDGWNRLDSVFVYDGQVANYTYDDALGLLTKTRYHNYQTPVCRTAIDDIDYTYDVRDRLTGISSRFFDENLYYDANHPVTGTHAYDVLAGSNYNGNINAGKATYKLSTASNYGTIGNIMDGDTHYGYTYDGMNRLVAADASVTNVLTTGLSTDPALPYGDENYTYDKTGNIRQLTRGLYFGPSASIPMLTVNNWAYAYTSGTNQLASITETGVGTLGSYTYDALGNMHTDTHKSITATTYGRANLPVTLAVGAVTMNYLYDAKDSRIYKGNSDIDEEYYLQDGAGKTIGIYNITNTAWDWYVYGKERIAKFGTTREFFETDHLGNTRVTYGTSLNCLTGISTFTVNNALDYYPYGKVLRSFAGSGLNKYGYQGSEREQELGDNDYYTLYRGLDADIGRWKLVDPKSNVNESPYAAMAGNPIKNTDVLGDTPGHGDDPIIPTIPRWEYDGISTFIPYAAHNLYAAFNNQVSNMVGTASHAAADVWKADYDGLATRASNSLDNTYKAFTTVPTWSQIKASVTSGENWENAVVGATSFYAMGGANLISNTGNAIRNLEIPVFRQYGGASSRLGDYYSFINPNYVPFYSKLAGLPAENTGAFLLRGNVKIGDLIGFGKVAPAARLVGTLGGLPELKIPSSFIKPLRVITKNGKTITF